MLKKISETFRRMKLLLFIHAYGIILYIDCGFLFQLGKKSGYYVDFFHCCGQVRVYRTIGPLVLLLLREHGYVIQFLHIYYYLVRAWERGMCVTQGTLSSCLVLLCCILTNLNFS